MTEDQRDEARRDLEQAAQHFRCGMERIADEWQAAVRDAERRFTAEREKIERTFRDAEARFRVAFGMAPREDGASPAPRRRPPPPAPLPADIRPDRPSGLTGGAAAPIDETDHPDRGVQ